MDTPAATHSKQRVDWIDYAKVTALYLMVVAHHGGRVDDDIIQWIYSFHMPLFFFFAGMLFKPRTPREVLKKDFKALIIPFLIINALCFVWAISIQHGYYHMPLPSVKRFIALIGLAVIGCGQDINGMHPVCIYAWFFIALLYIHLIASLGWRRMKPYLIIMSAIGIVGAVLMSDLPMYTPIGSALMALPFFTMGYLLKGITTIKPSLWWCFAVLMVAACAHFFLNDYNWRVDTNYMIFGRNVGLFYLTAVIGIVMATALAIILSRIGGARLRSWVIDLSVGAMVVVGLQDIPMFLSFKTMHELEILGLPDHNLPVFIFTLAIMAAFVVVIRLCRRYFPVILGGRG